jgi:ankyrin repeat protein
MQSALIPTWHCCRAATKNHEGDIIRLLKSEADVAAEDSDGWTALHKAAGNGHETVVQLLLEEGADVAAKDQIGRRALHRAAENGHEVMVRLLHEKGADVAAKDNGGRMALHRAAVRLLLEKGGTSPRETGMNRWRCGCCWRKGRTSVGDRQK